MKINIKQCKCKRKMFILNYKWKTFILSKNLIGNIEELKISVPRNTESSNDEIKRYKLSILKPNIRERIIPKCLRIKCRKQCYKDHHIREQIKTKTIINKYKTIHSMKFRHENLYPDLKYDDISSGALSSDEDIEILKSSTKMRMKELNDRSELFSASTYINTNKIRGSINSLDTLSLGNDVQKDIMKYKTNTHALYSHTMSEDMNIET